MKRISVLMAAAFMGIIFSGCIEVYSTLRVSKDGSGTLEKTVYMNDDALRIMTSLLGVPDDSAGVRNERFNLFDEDKFRQDAASLGKDVKYTSGERITLQEKQGYRITYSFDNVENVRIDQNPGRIIAAPAALNFGGEGSEEDFIRFRFKKGDISTLTIIMPTERALEKRRERYKDAADSIRIDPPSEENVIERLKGMRMLFVVDVKGQITETNAQYRDSSEIVIAQLDLGVLTGNPDNYRRFMQIKGKSVREAKAILNGVAGVKVETGEEVKVKFR